MSVALFDALFKYFSLKLITNLLHASLKKQRSFMINYQNSRKRHTHSQKTKRSQQYCSKTFTTSPHTLTNPHTMFLIIHPSLPLTSLCQFNYPKTSFYHKVKSIQIVYSRFSRSTWSSPPSWWLPSPEVQSVRLSLNNCIIIFSLHF